MKTKHLVAVFTLITAMIFGACDKTEPDIENDTVLELESVPEIYGNTAGNIVNGGIAAINEEWIYYRNNDDGQLYKVKLDDTGEAQLNDDDCYYINVVGDWVYYSLAASGHIYKILTDGTERTKLNDDISEYVNVVGDWIYYQNISDNSYLYKMRTDGTEKTALNSEFSTCVCVDGGWIYYINRDDGRRLYKILPDGSEKTRVGEDEIRSFCPSGEWVYYNYTLNTPLAQTEEWTSWDTKNYLYKIRVDGTERTKLAYGEFEYINVVGDWIYCDNSDIYKIRTDGSERHRLNYDKSHNINIIGDWIYYVSGYFGQKDYCRISTTPVVNNFDEGIVELNLTKLLGDTSYFRIHSILPVNGRYVSIITSRRVDDFTDDYRLIDIVNQKAAYSGTLKGKYIYSDMSDNGEFIIYSSDKMSEETQYYATYIYPDKSPSQKLDKPPALIEAQTQKKHIIEEQRGGIFEIKDGKQTELLPPVPEDYNDGDISIKSYEFLEWIDEDRFLYMIYGYEWITGFGVYNFKTGESCDAPDSGDKIVLGIIENLIYSYDSGDIYSELCYGIYQTDTDALETKLLFDPQTLAESDLDIKSNGHCLTGISMSKDKKLISLTYSTENERFETDYIIYILDSQDCDVKKRLHIFSTSMPHAWSRFADNGDLLVAGNEVSGRDKYAYIIPGDIINENRELP